MTVYIEQAVFWGPCTSTPSKTQRGLSMTESDLGGPCPELNGGCNKSPAQAVQTRERGMVRGSIGPFWVRERPYHRLKRSRLAAHVRRTSDGARLDFACETTRIPSRDRGPEVSVWVPSVASVTERCSHFL